MIKKMLTATVMIATLLIFVSCQEKKETKKNTANKASEKMQNQNANSKPTFRNLENKCPTCPESKCDTCPKDKCCTNEQENVALPKDEKTILSQEVIPEANFPLEEFKASLESQNQTSDIIETEKNIAEVHQ